MADISAEQKDSINSWVGTWSQGGNWQRGQPTSNEKVIAGSVASIESKTDLNERPSASFISNVSAVEQRTAQADSSAVYSTIQLIRESLAAVDIDRSIINIVVNWESRLNSREDSEIDNTIKLYVEDTSFPEHSQSVILYAVALSQNPVVSEESSSVRNDAVSSDLAQANAETLLTGNFFTHVNREEDSVPTSSETGNYLSEHQISDVLVPSHSQSVQTGFVSDERADADISENSSVRNDAVSSSHENAYAGSWHIANYFSGVEVLENFGDLESDENSSVIYYARLRDRIESTAEHDSRVDAKASMTELLRAFSEDIAHLDAEASSTDFMLIDDASRAFIDGLVRWQSEAVPGDAVSTDMALFGSSGDELHAESEERVRVVFTGSSSDLSVVSSFQDGFASIGRAIAEHADSADVNSVILDAVADCFNALDAIDDQSTTSVRYAFRKEERKISDASECIAMLFSARGEKADATDIYAGDSGLNTDVVEHDSPLDDVSSIHFDGVSCFEYLTAEDRIFVLSDSATVKWIVSRSRNFNVSGSDRKIRTSAGGRLFNVHNEMFSEHTTFKVSKGNKFKV